MTDAGIRTGSKSDRRDWVVTSVYALVMLVTSLPMGMKDIDWTDPKLVQRHTLVRVTSLIHSSVPDIALGSIVVVTFIALAWLLSRSTAVAVSAGFLTFLSYVIAMCVAFWGQPLAFPEMPASERDWSPLAYPTIGAGEHIGLALALSLFVRWVVTRRRPTET